MKNSAFIRFAWTTLVVLFLVIIAGSVVRMTGSGMGCPDWPKCFGHLLPPTEQSEVQFQNHTEYKKGQMIIVEDELLSAKEDFTSANRFSEENWEVYEKHNYAVFNVAHTWTEYINRLLGALSGLFVLVLFIWSVMLALKKKLPWWLAGMAFFTLLLLGFQAWLGRTVVDSHLATAKITAHLFGAIALIVSMLLIIRFGNTKQKFQASYTEKWLAAAALVFILIQFFLGTEVRTLVDEATNHQGAIFSKEKLFVIFGSLEFKIHRSFAWLILLTVALLSWKVWKISNWKKVHSWILALVVLEIVLGIVMAEFNFPFLSQPLHLLFACLLFACLFWIVISKKSTSTNL